VLKLRTVPAGQAVIREGGRDRSLFLIARGVVRASRHGGGDGGDGEEGLGTLMAGDFIGEMALLHGTPRAATCRAVTPCSIYELAFRDFEAVRAVCPAIQAAIEAADNQRRDPA
jgi:CPA1 family monovalent cation:H+ antiporter